MAIIRVTTGEDVENGSDGRTSLREAVAAAALTPEADAIVFAAAVATVTLTHPLVIEAGQLAIDGDRDDDGWADVAIGGSAEAALIVVQDLAQVEISGVRFRNIDIRPGPVAPAPDKPGTDPNPGSDGVFGENAADFIRIGATIVNFGALTLQRVGFSDIRVEAGASDPGGEGADGTSGAEAQAEIQGGPGGQGASGESGGAGGDAGALGGFAAGAVLNSGSLTLRDVGVGTSVEALGGAGGPGGAGGRGGDGGDGGSGEDSAVAPGPGGRGGDGAWGGDGGRGGDGGDGGRGGRGGDGTVSAGPDGAPGTRGLDGLAGIDGEGGLLDHFWLSDRGTRPQSVDSLVYSHAADAAASEGDALDVSIARLGSTKSRLTVAWSLRLDDATTGADFDGPRRGVVVFEPGGPDLHTVSIGLADDDIVEGDGGFVFRLRSVDVEGGGSAGLGTRALNAVIVDLSIPTGGPDTLRGRPEADRINGRGGDDAIRGLGAADRLLGGGGDDALYGGAGADALLGGAGDDRLFGGDDRDALRGGRGVDELVGGAAADAFVFDSAGEAGRGRNRDTILDMERNRDLIDLSGIDADTTRSGNQAFRFVGADGFSDTARELRYKNGLVSGDTDGDGRVDLQIDVANDERLDADDFIL